MPNYVNIFPILLTMAFVICVGGAILLFLRGRNNRSRRLLAGIMLAWGLIYVIHVAGMFFGNQYLNFIRTDVADPVVLVGGNLYLIILLLYPLEIVRPGWLSLKRVGIVLLPYVSVTLLYYFVLFLLGQKILVLHNIGQLIEHIGEFNVWYRLLMTLSIIIYLAFLFRLTCRYQKFYQQWCCNNYSDDEDINIAWLRQYGIGVMLIELLIFGCYLMEIHTVSLCTTLRYNVSFVTHSTKVSSTITHTQRIFSVIHWMKRMHCRKLNLEKNNCLPVRSVFRRAKAHFLRNYLLIVMRWPIG